MVTQLRSFQSDSLDMICRGDEQTPQSVPMDYRYELA
jgi:hypothetical protein